MNKIYDLISLNNHLYMVDKEAEIAENDWFYIIGGHVQNFGLRKCYWRALNQDGWNDADKSWTRKCLKRYFLIYYLIEEF